MSENRSARQCEGQRRNMTGVSALSGYVTTKDGDLLAFSIMINGLIKPVKEYKYGLEDQICTLLTEFSYH